ncbi:MAG: N-acetylmuramoyl-L-alanine amidase, partial [Chitinophagia bacterium]|nr:N-acetylmuramoyl-L-alanine amidase [Chitinophagia bacterium]
APRRKIDPGPAFPMAGFKGKVMGRNDRASGLYRTTTAVNLRSTPTVDPNNANKINTLPAGTQVDVQRLEGNWSFVAVEQIVDGHNDLEGWVATKYLEKTA